MVEVSLMQLAVLAWMVGALAVASVRVFHRFGAADPGPYSPAAFWAGAVAAIAWPFMLVLLFVMAVQGLFAGRAAGALVLASLCATLACGGSSPGSGDVVGTWSMQITPTGAAAVSGQLVITGTDPSLSGWWSSTTTGGYVSGSYDSTNGLRATLTCALVSTGAACAPYQVHASLFLHQPQGDLLQGYLSSTPTSTSSLGSFSAQR